MMAFMRRLMVLGVLSSSLLLPGCGDREGNVPETTPEQEASPVLDEPDIPDDAYVYRCGDTLVAARFTDVDRMEMTVGEETWTMLSVVAASGARFQAGDDESTVFWIQGEGAMLTLSGTQYPECTQVAVPADEGP